MSTILGKAYKIGAGIQGHRGLRAGNKIGRTITSGEYTSVGVAGGYTQGGGHSESVPFLQQAAPAGLILPQACI